MSPSAARHRCLARVGQVPLAAVLPSGAAPSPMAPELRCLTDVPLNAIEWHAHRALDATEWRGSRHMRSCQEMSCHSVLPDGTQTAHSALPSGTAGPADPASGCHRDCHAREVFLRQETCGQQGEARLGSCPPSSTGPQTGRAGLSHSPLRDVTG